MKNLLLILLFLYLSDNSFGQIVTKSIKNFGAIGDGKFDCQPALIKAAAFINKQKGNVVLIIPKGTYIIGGQVKVVNAYAYCQGQTSFSLTDCKNVTIKGENGAKLKYKDGLKFGSFNPKDGSVYKPSLPFSDKSFAAELGCAFQFYKCTNIKMENIKVNGNSLKMELGGYWGDVGYQLWHYGIYISESKKVSILNCEMSYFALDGLCVNNTGLENDSIIINNSIFSYNGRQGFSWIGGNGLIASNCKFSHTGKANIVTAPGAGIDFEAENGNIIKNGVFNNCEIINNVAIGIGAESGPSRDITFNDCTFWGVTGWSIWVNKPNFVFKRCNVYGSFANGYKTTDIKEATKFYDCKFEDKKYLGQEVHGRYLIECDERKVMLFENCTFTTNYKKAIWYSGLGFENDIQKAQFTNCIITINNNNLPQNDFYAIIRKCILSNCTFNLNFPKEKNYVLGEDGNVSKKMIINYLKTKVPESK